VISGFIIPHVHYNDIGNPARLGRYTRRDGVVAQIGPVPRGIAFWIDRQNRDRQQPWRCREPVEHLGVVVRDRIDRPILQVVDANFQNHAAASLKRAQHG
jgi:hypothetical protein